MGLRSLFSSPRNAKVEEITIRPQTSTMAQRSEKTSMKTSVQGVDAVRPRSSHQSKNRRSWFGARSEDISALPQMPPPPMPTTTDTTTFSDKRRSVASVKSVKKSNNSKRASFWASSNPDESDSGVDIPPVPALSRGASKESVYTLSQAEPAAQKPTPIQRKKYVPKSAAKGFLVTTSGATEDKRKSYRQSFKLDEDADLVCLTQEQQIEWAKLMDARARLATPVSNSSVKYAGDGQTKYSNNQALAALEFGIAR